MCEECCIGLIYDYDDTTLVTERELISKLASYNEHIDYALSEYGEDFMKIIGDKVELRKYFDKRYNTDLNRFEFCPYCGKKIDWKELKKKYE